MITQELELYLMDKKITPSVNLVQADTGRKIKLSFPDYKIPLGATAEIWAIKPSGKIVFNEAEVSDNTVLVKVTNQMIAEKGIAIAQIKFKNAAEMISSFSFNIRCSEDISGNGVESENEITALDKFLTEQKEKLDDAIAEKTAQITENTNNISQNTDDINALKENKIEKNQGDSNKGKFLKVGEDGNVVPEDIPTPDVSGQISKHNESTTSHKDIRKDISTLKEDITILDNTKADAIVETASGENIKTELSSDSKLVNLKVFGKSERVVTNGYQLFDASKLPTKSQGGATVTNNGDGSFTISGSGDLTEEFRVAYKYSHEDTLMLLKSGTINLKLDADNTSGIGVFIQLKSGNLPIVDLNRKAKSAVITQEMLNTSDTILELSLFSANGVRIEQGVIKPMLYQDGDGTWEPFTNGKPSPAPDNESPIKNVGDKGDVEIEITGKNLIDFRKVHENGTTNNPYKMLDNGYVLKRTVDNGQRISVFPVKLKRGVTYSFKFNSKFILGEKEEVKAYLHKLGQYITNTFTPENDTDEIAIYLDRELNKEAQVEITNIQLEVNNSPTPYEPYKEPQSITLQTPNGLSGIKVVSGGNYTDEKGQQWVSDEICLARGKYVQRIERRIFNGSENWETYTLQNKPNSYICKNVNKAIPFTALFNRYISMKHFALENGQGANGANSFVIRNDNCTTVEALKAELAKNNLEMIVILETPVERDLTPEEIQAFKNIHTNYPTTIISNDENAGMEVSYVADTKNFLLNQNKTLQDKILEIQNALITSKISGGGIKITDSAAKLPIRNLRVFGKSEQVQTKGYQLFDASRIPSKSMSGASLINNNDGSFSISGSGTLTNDFGTSYTLKHEELVRIIKPGSINLKNGLKQSVYFEVSFLSETLGNHYIRDGAFEITQEMLDTSDFRIMFVVYGKSGASIPDATFKPMIYQDGDGTWEPFTGGKPYPAPDNESPIVDVGDKGYITLDITGENVEPQKLTLATPNGLPGIKVESGGNYTDANGQQWICDEIVEKNGMIGIERNVKKYVFVGNENINKNVGSLGQEDRFTVTLPFEVNKEYSGVTISNCYINDKNWAVTDNSMYLHKTVIYIRHNGITDCKQLQDFFGSNEVYFIYPSKAYDFEPLSQEVQDKIRLLHSNYPTTTISNDENAEMELTYTVDTKSYVDSKILALSKAML